MLRLAWIFLIGIFLVPMIFLVFVFYGHDSDGTGWYQNLWDRDTLWARIIAIALFPFFFTLTSVVDFIYSYWEKLGE
jgi:hypothetical protein